MKRFFLLTLLVSVFLISLTSAVTLSEPTVCCEQTKVGSVGEGVATCINTKQENCNPVFNVAPASCDYTQFCELGTCYDSSEGLCMDNTPRTTCEESGGTWDERDSSEIPQCQLGCCLIAEQAAFVPLVRCKRLSSFYGVEMNYRSDIGNELQCILEAQSQDMGACVYEEDFENSCKFTTRADCSAAVEVEVVNETEETGKKFYKDYLCSAEELNTVCARQTTTECYSGKVYWVDSCGNRENVYLDGTEAKKQKSWNNGKIADDDEVCAASGGSDPNCGNCDYFQGAICGDSEFGTRPATGDLACISTKCTDWKGIKRKNGESWCRDPAETTDKIAAPGSRYFKETCIDGEIKIEPCADFRNEICIEGETQIETEDSRKVFTSAACRVNRWQDCILQDEEDDCLNIDRRDCKWMPPVEGMWLSEAATATGVVYSNPDGSFTNPTYSGSNFGGSDEGSTGVSSKDRGGICVPAFTPGFNFWEQGDSNEICSQATAKCMVEYRKGLLDGDDWSVESGKECLGEQWALDANAICSSLGDCGGSINYLGEFSDEGYNWVGTLSKNSNDPDDVDKQEFTRDGEIKIKRTMTGFASAQTYVINDDLKLNAGGYVYVKTP